MRANSLTRLSALPFLLVTVLAVSGCASTVEVASAKDSNNPACAPMMVALPDALADAGRRTTSSQATAAWGDPTTVVLRCGVTPPTPTTDICVGVNGVDWVIKEGDPVWTITTYGREPATEILLDPKKVNSSTVLAQLSSAANKLPRLRGCVGPSDVENLPATG